MSQHPAYKHVLHKGRPVVPGTNVALLSETDKMPGFSWSLPAGNAHAPGGAVKGGTCPGAEYHAHPVTGKPAICKFCYANPDSVVAHKGGKETRRGGRYDTPAVRNAQRTRAKWLLRCLKTEEGRREWVEWMVAAVFWATRTFSAAAPRPGAVSHRVPFFRVHDSGDVFSEGYAALWDEVVRRLPDVRFWMPTRSWHNQPRTLVALVDLARNPNIAVKPSALWVDDAPPAVEGLDAGTTVSTGTYDCPARHQGNKCRECRSCWDKGNPKTYPAH